MLPWCKFNGPSKEQIVRRFVRLDASALKLPNMLFLNRKASKYADPGHLAEYVFFLASPTIGGISSSALTGCSFSFLFIRLLKL